MGNCVSKRNRKNQYKSNTSLDQQGCIHGYPPINFRKIRKSGFRIGAHVDIGVKDFEAGMTFGRNNTHEIKFSENNAHLQLLKSLENQVGDCTLIKTTSQKTENPTSIENHEK